MYYYVGFYVYKRLHYVEGDRFHFLSEQSPLKLKCVNFPRVYYNAVSAFAATLQLLTPTLPCTWPFEYRYNFWEQDRSGIRDHPILISIHLCEVVHSKKVVLSGFSSIAHCYMSQQFSFLTLLFSFILYYSKDVQMAAE